MKYLKYYFRVFKISLMEQMTFRANFILWSFNRAIILLVNVLFFKIIFSAIPSLNGWTQYESLLVLGISGLVSGLGSLTFFPFMYRFSDLIKSGDFDFLLTRPMDIHFQSAFNNIDMDDLAVVPSALLLIAYSTLNLGQHLNLFGILLMFVMVVNSLVFIFSLITLIESFAFKNIETRSASFFIFDFMKMSKYPVNSFKNIPRIISYLFVPVAIITTIPAEMVIGRVDHLWVIGAIMSTTLLFLFSRWVFMRNLGFYSSASS